jgi:CubicO group peptidase (beta-lactamase class C family)
MLTVPAQDLASTGQYLAVLGGHPAKFAPGERFSYSNGGYVVLALIAERVSGMPFPDLLRERVCVPAGMCDTEFLRSDELPERTALGYLSIEGVPRTNMFHLPVRGSGAGGIYTTASDISAFWQSLFAGKHRVRGLGNRDAAAAQRGASRVDALRARLLAPRLSRYRDAGRIRRRCLLPHRA